MEKRFRCRFDAYELLRSQSASRTFANQHQRLLGQTGSFHSLSYRGTQSPSNSESLGRVHKQHHSHTEEGGKESPREESAHHPSLIGGPQEQQASPPEVNAQEHPIRALFNHPMVGMLLISFLLIVYFHISIERAKPALAGEPGPGRLPGP